MKKTNTVQYLATKSKGKTKFVPKIQLAGKWLAAAGFKHQDKIAVTSENGVIKIQKII